MLLRRWSDLTERSLAGWSEWTLSRLQPIASHNSATSNPIYTNKSGDRITLFRASHLFFSAANAA